MKAWKWDSEGFEAICECGEPICDMKLKLVYIFGMCECEVMKKIIEYGGTEDYSLATELLCDCGKVFKQDEDYRLEWQEQDTDWVWTLEVDME